MARFIVVTTSILVLLAFAAAVEGRMLLRETRPIQLHPIDGTNSVNASISNTWINRRLLQDNNGGKLNGKDECQLTCDQVKFRSMCRSLTKLPGVTTPQALLRAALRVAIVKAKLAKGRVDAYAATYHGGNPLASMLSTCSDAYGNAADSLEETQRLIDGGHATNADLNTKLSAATTEALGCNDAFDERPEIRSPFQGTMRNTYRVVDNVLNIAYVVKQV